MLLEKMVPRYDYNHGPESSILKLRMILIYHELVLNEYIVSLTCCYSTISFLLLCLL